MSQFPTLSVFFLKSSEDLVVFTVFLRQKDFFLKVTLVFLNLSVAKMFVISVKYIL